MKALTRPWGGRHRHGRAPAVVGLLALTLIPLAACGALPAGGGPGSAPSHPDGAELEEGPAPLALALPEGVRVESEGAMGGLLAQMGAATCNDDPDAAEVAALATDERSPLSPERFPPNPGEPRLWVAELAGGGAATVDVGSISSEMPSDHRFTLVNAGGGELRIQGLSASCGCTRVEAEAQTLGPGESTILHVTYDPRVSEEMSHEVRKQVRLRTNDPRRPLAEFTFVARQAP